MGSHHAEANQTLKLYERGIIDEALRDQWLKELGYVYQEGRVVHAGKLHREKRNTFRLCLNR